MHRSSKLVDVLKVLLCYSNNFMAERIGDALGGPQGVTTAVTKSLNINPDEVSLSSTSGLGINRVTPRAMMKILRGLRAELAKNKLTLSDILPVAGGRSGHVGTALHRSFRKRQRSRENRHAGLHRR